MLTLEQFARVLHEVPDRYRVAAGLSFGAGLRWGETAALKPRDFDGLDGGPMTVHVRRTLQEVAGEFTVKPRPKTEAGARHVPVPDWAAEIVRMHVSAYCPRLDDFLVSNEAGGHVSRGYARLYVLRPALVKAGLMGEVERLSEPSGKQQWRAKWTDKALGEHQQVFTTHGAAVRAVARSHYPAPSSWHGLRHAYVSGLVTAGLDPVHVAVAAGHTDPAFTLRTYAHPSSEAAARIRQAQPEFEVEERI